MCAKYYETTHEHPYPWHEVAGAIFLRYPNPFSSHVLSEDTLHRRLQSSGNVLYTKRFITKTNKIPAWGEKFLFGIKRFVPLVEESFVDRGNKVIVTYTRNVGLSRFMSAVEKVEYRVHPEDPDRTVAHKQAWIDSGFYGLRSAVKSFGVERFKQNCHRATEGFNYVLQRFHTQQHYLNEVRARKWREMREKAKTAADLAKAHSTVHAAQRQSSDE